MLFQWGLENAETNSVNGRFYLFTRLPGAPKSFAACGVWRVESERGILLSHQSARTPSVGRRGICGVSSLFVLPSTEVASRTTLISAYAFHLALDH